MPYVVLFWIFGWTLVKRIVGKEWRGNKGLADTVSKWEGLSSEERMEAIRPGNTTRWIQSPTPTEENLMRNEQVYKEGIIHPLPKTEIEEVKKEK